MGYLFLQILGFFIIIEYNKLIVISLLDIDECSIRFWYDCLDHQYCINSIGSYTCQCVYGYRKNLDTGACQGMLIKMAWGFFYL